MAAPAFVPEKNSQTFFFFVVSGGARHSVDTVNAINFPLHDDEFLLSVVTALMHDK
jgi:hypothetical protein